MPDTRTPDDRLGVFKELSDVPDSRRFYQFEAAYEGQDTWFDYRDRHELSERMSYEWGLYSDRWKSHMDDRGRHHALARPSDVETWSEWMLSQFSVNRAYQHWNVIEGFYEWLKHHTDHPHTYNPFHMAASKDGSSTRKIWTEKMVKAND